MIDWTKPVRCIRNKEPLTIITTDGRELCPVVAYVGVRQLPDTFTADGRPYPGHDVMVENVPEPMMLWLLVHRLGIAYVSYKSIECAKLDQVTHGGDLYEITLTEGEPPKIEEVKK